MPPLNQRDLINISDKSLSALNPSGTNSNLPFKVDLNQDFLNNRYKIIEKIGFGAQSDVYKAQDSQNNNKM